MALHSNDETESRRGVDRRTVLRSSAWAVPVVMAATAVPAAAASGDATPGLEVRFVPTNIFLKLPDGLEMMDRSLITPAHEAEWAATVMPQNLRIELVPDPGTTTVFVALFDPDPTMPRVAYWTDGLDYGREYTSVSGVVTIPAGDIQALHTLDALFEWRDDHGTSAYTSLVVSVDGNVEGTTSIGPSSGV